MSGDLPLIVCLIAVSVLFIGALAVGLVLVVRDTIRRRGNFGINLKPAVCTQCGTPAPAIRKPANRRQMLWGGWTCAECGYELDKWGRPVAEQNTLARWAVLPAVEEADRRRAKDDRVRGKQDKTQRREER
jgi:uncharacterized membrane protein